MIMHAHDHKLSRLLFRGNPRHTNVDAFDVCGQPASSYNLEHVCFSWYQANASRVPGQWISSFSRCSQDNRLTL
jgi:hypothetical protein